MSLILLQDKNIGEKHWPANDEIHLLISNETEHKRRSRKHYTCVVSPAEHVRFDSDKPQCSATFNKQCLCLQEIDQCVLSLPWSLEFRS